MVGTQLDTTSLRLRTLINGWKAIILCFRLRYILYYAGQRSGVKLVTMKDNNFNYLQTKQIKCFQATEEMVEFSRLN